MLKKKIMLGMLSTTMASLLSAVPVHAQTVTTAELTGATDVTYRAGGVGPIEPIDPENSENDKNNWMVYYPKAVTLTDSNKIEKSNYENEKSKGRQLKFKVRQQVAGKDGMDDVNEHNVGNGIKITATAADATWAKGSDQIIMENSNSTVIMGIGNENKLITKEEDLLTLSYGNNSDKNAYAVLTDTNGVKNGIDYATKLTFKFEKQPK